MTLHDYTKKMQKFEADAVKLRRHVFRTLEKSLESDLVPAHKYVKVEEADSDYTIEVYFHPKRFSLRFVPARRGEDLDLQVQIIDVTERAVRALAPPVIVGPFAADKAHDAVVQAFLSYLDAHWPG